MQKSISVLCQCPIYSYSLKLSECPEEIYFLLLNRFILHNNYTAVHLIRFVFYPETNLVYINSFDSYFKVEEQTKDLLKRRADINSKIEMYVVMKPDVSVSGPLGIRASCKNGMDYCFEGSSIKLLNLCHKEDCLIGNRLPISKKQRLEEIRKAKKIRDGIMDWFLEFLY